MCWFCCCYFSTPYSTRPRTHARTQGIQFILDASAMRVAKAHVFETIRWAKRRRERSGSPALAHFGYKQLNCHVCEIYYTCFMYYNLYRNVRERERARARLIYVCMLKLKSPPPPQQHFKFKCVRSVCVQVSWPRSFRLYAENDASVCATTNAAHIRCCCWARSHLDLSHTPRAWSK